MKNINLISLAGLPVSAFHKIVHDKSIPTFMRKRGTAVVRSIRLLIPCLLASLILTLGSVHLFAQSVSSKKARLVILADMGNEPDEEQQMMHLLMYANEFDLEGLIAVTGKYLQPASSDPYKKVVHPELFHNLIEGYSKIYNNLKKHSVEYPEPDYLTSIVVSGQPGYGIEGTGDRKSSQGSDLLVQILTKNDLRPVYVVVNAGSNTLAQAIRDYEKSHSQDELDTFISKLRVYENGAQDNAGAWICAHYPKIHWIRSNYQTYCYGGPGNDGESDNTGDFDNLGPHTWQPYEYSSVGQHQWAVKHIIGNHGPFGRYWPLRQFHSGMIHFVEGGGTIPWLGLVNKGLYDVNHPHWGGWSGRFTKEKKKNFWSKHTSVNTDEKKYGDFYMYREAEDTWINPENGDEYKDWFTPVWRFRRAFFNDFQCRMDWCVQPYDKANHNPVAAVNGDKTDDFIFMNADAGEEIVMDGSTSSDPDNDDLQFLWWNYHESGNYSGKLELKNATKKILKFNIPGDASGKEIHIILEVKDKSEIASMYDYRRIIINVK